MQITAKNIAILENDTHISQWVKDSGRLDHDGYALPIILNHVRAGDTVVDAGAFIGDHTIAYCNAVGTHGQVYAFEPNPLAFECLEYNCSTATLFNCGLSNANETVEYSRCDNAGASRIIKNSSKDSISIKTITLDSLNLNACNLIKIDVEGYEMNVLKGAKNTIGKFLPVLWIEINSGALAEQGTCANDITAFLSQFNYNITPFPEIGEQYDILCTPKN
jgi:FkbM family methyltransferase